MILQPDAPEMIGVVLDADAPDMMTRWSGIRSKSELRRYPWPETPQIDGTIITGPDGKPKLGFWLMPNNSSSGMLEDFLIDLAPPEGMRAARSCVDNARQQQVASFKEVHLSKAVLHTYLAWQDEPGKPLGQAVTSRALQPNTAIAQKFTTWLTKLFSL